MRSVGKRMGSKIYAHRKYEIEIVPEDILREAQKTLHEFELFANLVFDYKCIRFDTKNRSVAFQMSPDFDESDEPIVGHTFVFLCDGTTKCTLQKINPQIWHHKWMWVKSDYHGFDVEASKARSELWKPHVSKEEKSKIGYKDFWDSIKHRWES